MRAAKPKRCLTGAGPWLIHGMRTPAAAREGAISRISAVREVGRTPRDGRAPSGAAEIPAHSGATGTKVSLLFTWAHPLPSRRRKLTEEHRKKPKDPGRRGQLLFLDDFCTPAPAGAFRPPGEGPPARALGRPGHGRRAVSAWPGGPSAPGPDRRAARGPAHLAVRTRPSCTTDTTRSPASVKTWPRASPRAPAAVGDSWSYRSQRSARNGR